MVKQPFNDLDGEEKSKLSGFTDMFCIFRAYIATMLVWMDKMWRQQCHLKPKNNCFESGKWDSRPWSSHPMTQVENNVSNCLHMLISFSLCIWNAHLETTFVTILAWKGNVQTHGQHRNTHKLNLCRPIQWKRRGWAPMGHLSLCYTSQTTTSDLV